MYPKIDTDATTGKEEGGIFFMGLYDPRRHQGKPYPAWRYHRHYDPILVTCTSDDLDLRARGYDEINAPVFANFNMQNWFWDIEDMSPKQLASFAKDEYDIDLPADANQESLQRALFELTKFAPNNRGRLVLMAQTIKMNYEATQDEIRRAINQTNNIDNERYVVEM